MIVIVSCTGDAVDLRLGLVSAGMASASWDIAIPRDDHLRDALDSLALRARSVIELPSLTHDDGATQALLFLGPAIILIVTDGANYLCGEIERRTRAAGWQVHVRVRPWEQRSLF